MSWITYSLLAIVFTSFSDMFRKLGSNLKDPYFSALIFQTGTIVTTLIMYLIYSRKIENNPRDMAYAFVGGVLIAIFTLFSIKALQIGPGVSTVMPVVRIGGVAGVAVLGVLLFKDQLSIYKIIGLLLSTGGIYLLFYKP